MKLKIKVKLFNNTLALPEVLKKGEWIDLRASETVRLDGPQAGTLKYHEIDGEKVGHRHVKFDRALIPLGVAMELPKGFEAVILPRSSTFKKFGVTMSNSEGIVDNTYSGDNDEWKFPVLAFEDTKICKGDRICQFRIQLSQKATMWQKLRWLFSNGVKLKFVDHLNDDNRGGFGSTGVR